jgi:hypothetical protein
MSWDQDNFDRLWDGVHIDHLKRMDLLFHETENQLDAELASIFGRHYEGGEDDGDGAESVGFISMGRSDEQRGEIYRKGIITATKVRAVVTPTANASATPCAAPANVTTREKSTIGHPKPTNLPTRTISTRPKEIRNAEKNAEMFWEERPFDCDSLSPATPTENPHIPDDSIQKILVMENIKKVTPDKAMETSKQFVHAYQEAMDRPPDRTRNTSGTPSVRSNATNSTKKSNETIFQSDRFISVLDQPFQYWSELNTIFRQVFAWTPSQRGRMVHHLIHFLELKLGVDEYDAAGLLLPTLVVEEAWRALVLETSLYRDVLNFLHDFHGKPRKIIDYSLVRCSGVPQKDRIDKVRRTQSLFLVYFQETMPVNINDEPSMPSSGPATASSSHILPHMAGMSLSRPHPAVDTERARLMKSAATRNLPSPNILESMKTGISTISGSDDLSSIAGSQNSTFQVSPSSKREVANSSAGWNPNLSPGTHWSGETERSESSSADNISDILLGLGMLEF